MACCERRSCNSAKELENGSGAQVIKLQVELFQSEIIVIIISRNLADIIITCIVFAIKLLIIAVLQRS